MSWQKKRMRKEARAMSVNELLRSSRLSWLAASGKESDVVLSSRIRLARNFREIPFPNAHVR